MKVSIISIHEQGDFDKEYVLMRVREDCDIGHYILADSTYTDSNQVSNKIRHTYWFPDKQVKKGELVSLWTKPGRNTTGKTDDGSKVHRFFWGLKRAVWNDHGDCAVLFEISTWQFFRGR